MIAATQTPNLWVPVCCERVMRYNMFLQKNGTGYGSLVCSVCNKNVTFELEHMAKLDQYGEGARVLNMVGCPKPPKEPRLKPAEDSNLNDHTL